MADIEHDEKHEERADHRAGGDDAYTLGDAAQQFDLLGRVLCGGKDVVLQRLLGCLGDYMRRHSIHGSRVSASDRQRAITES